MAPIRSRREVIGIKETKKNIVLFAGTTGGRLLTEYLQEFGQSFVIRVATGYARDLLGGICRPDQAGCMGIRQGRLDVTEMERMFDELQLGLIIDATHPYAVEVTRDIRIACSGRNGLWFTRCLHKLGIKDSRPGAGVIHMPGAGVVYMPDVETAVIWLSSVAGNILVIVGSEELSSCTRIRDYEQRTYARALPSKEAAARCRSLGFESRHIITMQGPSSEEMNLAQLREHGRTYLTTENDGVAEGFSERIKMAHRAGTTIVVTDRPGSGEGTSLDEIEGQLKEWVDHEKKGSTYRWFKTSHISDVHRNEGRKPTDGPDGGLPGDGPGGDGCGPDAEQYQHVRR